jgi:Carboxypeptidase regulatory-like domain/TonB dependent receptor/TonB-dependent Receptor Plug Domain
MKTSITRLCTLGVLMLLPTIVAAQGTTGSISGTVTDPQKSVVPGVTILVTQVETGAQRTQVSDDHGRYRVLDLPPGTYQVQAELQGFLKVVRDQLVVAIGKDTLADIEMRVGGVSEEVTVTGETSAVSIGSTTAGGLVTTKQIAELPLNGRSFLQLATLQPGVVTSRGTAKDFTGGFSNTQLAIGGARPEQTGFLMDGTNIADVSDKAPSSLSGVLLGVDTVQEFNVQTHGYSAEFGRAAGGVMSTVTKSGTNQIHGSGFEFHRDDALNSKNFFASGDAPPFRRDQFGGTIGGPIFPNKLFYFGSYEQLRDRNSVTEFARLPDANAHNGLVPVNGVLTNVGVNATVKPYLDLLFPIPTGQNFGDGTAELVHSETDPTDEHFGVTKFDYNLGRRDQVMVRWSRDDSKEKISQSHPLFNEHTTAYTRYFTTQDQHLFTSNLLNTVRFAANRTNRTDDLLPDGIPGGIPQALYFSTDPHFGAIDITGVSTAGSIATTPVNYTQDIFQIADTLTWNKGSHVFKTGMDLQNYHFDGTSFSRYGGTFRFRNVQEFLTLRRSATAQADRFTGNLPGTDTFRQMRQWYNAFFVQDDWRATDTLSIQAGLRYDFVTDPKELHGKVAGLLSLNDLNTSAIGVTPGTPLFKNPSYKSFAPRLGVAWNPLGDKKSTIKAGWGMFYQPLTTSFYRGTTFRVYPYFAGVDIRQPAVFGPGNIAVLAAGVDPATVQKRSEFIYYDEKQPYTDQWHVHFDRDLGHSMTAQVGYIGSSGHNLPFYGDPNTTPSQYVNGVKMLVPGATIRYPAWGRIRTRINVARSNYEGATLSLNKRFSDNWQAQISYTYGNSHDTWSGGQIGGSDFDNGAGSATDWWDPEYEYGPSSFDIRHTLVTNAVYVLPFFQDKTGLSGALLKGWQIGGVAQFSSGLPFTPFESYDQIGDGQSDTGLQKPNLSGTVNYPRTAAQWFDPSAFTVPAAGVFGNAHRNSLRGPGLKVADVSIFKNQRLGKRYGMQFRFEAFNAFNWVNLGLPDFTIFNAGGVRNPTAGRITSTSTPARQLQLGVKFLF